jgi:hypothetical protein
MLLGHGVVAETGCNWYLRDINICSLSKKVLAELKFLSHQNTRTNTSRTRFGLATCIYSGWVGIFSVPFKLFTNHGCLQDLISIIFRRKLKNNDHFIILSCLRDLLEKSGAAACHLEEASG